MSDDVQRHRLDLCRRIGDKPSAYSIVAGARSTETLPPTGQAADWFWDVTRYVPRGKSGTAWKVARQIARLCGDDSEVTMPRRSLVDAVQTEDAAGRSTAYVERGRDVLVDLGWLEVETVGKGRGARTTWRLLPGERVEWMPGWDDAPTNGQKIERSAS